MYRQTKRRKKANPVPVIAVLILTVIVAALGIRAYIRELHTPSTEHVLPSSYFAVPEGTTAIFADGRFLDTYGVERDGTLYVPYETAETYITDKIFYDDLNGILTLTTPTQIIRIQSSDGREVIAEGGEVYLSVDFLSAYSAADCSFGEEPSRLVIWKDKTLSETETAAEASLRTGPDIKAPILSDLPAGAHLRVLSETEENGFIAVASDSGIPGYVLRVELGPIRESRPPQPDDSEYSCIRKEGDIVLLFHQTDSQAANDALVRSLTGVSGINVIAPTWFFLNSTDGQMTDLTSAAYVQEAAARGMTVWAVANDFDGAVSSQAETGEALRNTYARDSMIRTITDGAIACGAEGVCLDFENVSASSAGAYLAFIRELSAVCRSRQLILSVCSYVPQPYNAFLNRPAQAEVADYLIIMAYDEHYAGSETAGSVSSISWVRAAVSGGVEEATAEKTIIALPFYTRLWETVSSERPTSRAMGMQEAQQVIAENGMQTRWDAELGQTYAYTVGGSPKKEMWVEDLRSLELKLTEVQQGGVSGVAFWKLGLEDYGVWPVISDYFKS